MKNDSDCPRWMRENYTGEQKMRSERLTSLFRSANDELVAIEYPNTWTKAELLCFLRDQIERNHNDEPGLSDSSAVSAGELHAGAGQEAASRQDEIENRGTGCAEAREGTWFLKGQVRQEDRR